MKFGADFLPAAHAATATEVFDEDEFVSAVFDERTAKVHRLNPVASAVWVMCDGTKPVASIVRELVDVFGQDRTLVASNVDKSLDMFWLSGLLASSPPPESEPDPAISQPTEPNNVLERLHDP